MNKWFILALVWLLVAVQVAVFATVRPAEVVPQLLLVGILFVAAYRSLALTLVVAVWGSWWLLVFSPLPSGFWIILYVLASLLMYGAAHIGIETTKLSGMVMVLAVAILAVNLLGVLILSVMGGEMLVGWSLVRLVALELAATLILALILRPLLQLIVRPVN